MSEPVVDASVTRPESTAAAASGLASRWQRRSVLRVLPRQDNFDAFAEAMEAFFGDLTVMEPKLLAMYDELLPRIDRMLGAESPQRTER
jgi:hypothetical protein